MPRLKKTLEELKAESREMLRRSGQVTFTQDGGAASGLLDIGAIELSELYDAQEFSHVMGRLSSASGVFLDMIGQGRGVLRDGAAAAAVTREDQAIRFFSSDGRTPLKGLLPGGKVASGTLATSQDGTVSYEVTADSYPDDVQVELFVPATSGGTGATQNVGADVLTTHDLGVGDILVTNDVAIATARDVETDANYRYRIAKAPAAAAGAVEDAVRLAAFSFAGVARVEIRPFSHGVGTFEVLVVPVGNRFPADVLRGIETAVRRAAAVGTRVSVRAPAELPVEMTIQLDFRRAATAADRSRIREAARQAVLRYLGEIPVGGELVLAELTSRVMDADDAVKDMRILLFRFRAENLVLRNVRAEPDEMFVPAQVQSPIRVL